MSVRALFFLYWHWKLLISWWHVKIVKIAGSQIQSGSAEPMHRAAVAIFWFVRWNDENKMERGIEMEKSKKIKNGSITCMTGLIIRFLIQLGRKSQFILNTSIEMGGEKQIVFQYSNRKRRERKCPYISDERARGFAPFHFDAGRNRLSSFISPHSFCRLYLSLLASRSLRLRSHYTIFFLFHSLRLLYFIFICVVPFHLWFVRRTTDAKY